MALQNICKWRRRPCFNISVHGSVKAVAVMNIIGVFLCCLMVVRDVVEREGFQSTEPLHETQFTEDSVLKNSTIAKPLLPNETEKGVSSRSKTPFHYAVWALLLLKDLVDFIASILLFRAAINGNLIYCKLYFFSTFLVLQAFTFWLIDISLLRVGYTITISVVLACIFHAVYKPYSVWVVMNFMKTIIEDQKQKEIEVRRSPRRLTEAEIEDFYHGSQSEAADGVGLKFSIIEIPTVLETGNGVINGDLPVKVQDRSLELSRHDATKLPYPKGQFEVGLDEFSIDEEKPLGMGEFGSVFTGNLISNESRIKVAVKTTKPCSESLDTEYFKALLDEIKIMTHIGNHRNIINLLGVCTSEIQSRKIWILTELCELGSLENYLKVRKATFVSQIDGDQWINTVSVSKSSNYVKLRSTEEIKTQDLVNWSYQIAHGMEFLASKKVIHGDLAARNVLLTKSKEAKIADFGLSRKLYNYVIYARDEETALPWRYMAIESLRNLTFSYKTDVWAFGITVWEIFSLGDQPFSNYEYGQEFISNLMEGMRLERPVHCPLEIYTIMRECWEQREVERPSFQQLVPLLETILAKSQDLIV